MGKPGRHAGHARRVTVSNGYAYVADGQTLQIVDVSPPSSASIVKTVELVGLAHDVSVSDGYAYVAVSTGGNANLNMIDVNPPEAAQIVNIANTGPANGVQVLNGYAYLVWPYVFKIVDVASPIPLLLSRKLK